jgi:hypothetical protein
LEHPHRSALENHVHRTPRLGNHGLLNVRIGINRCNIDALFSDRSAGHLSYARDGVIAGRHLFLALLRRCQHLLAVTSFVAYTRAGRASPPDRPRSSRRCPEPPEQSVSLGQQARSPNRRCAALCSRASALPCDQAALFSALGMPALIGSAASVAVS